ncbi:hypothetical protein ACFSBZ_03035 [Amnibacterium flavum]|nr:hypothetical protein [Amnibacterium flavum]
MGDKSVRKSSSKTAATKSLKEKRNAKADKRASNDRSAANTDAVSKVKNR